MNINDYKELPTASEYLYAMQKEPFMLHHEYAEVIEGYAQLVAEYRVKQALESANNRMIDQAFNLRIHKQLIESLEMAILNA